MGRLGKIGAGVNGAVGALALGAHGELAVGGAFDLAGGAVSSRFARLATTCPAASALVPTQCPGAGTLTASSLPWIGAMFRATGTGLPMNSLVLSLHGFTSFAPGLCPLDPAFPQALPGCALRVSPDIVVALTTTTGTVQSEVFVPEFPPIVGMNFFHQMLPIAVGPLGEWTSMHATNALQLTAGVF